RRRPAWPSVPANIQMTAQEADSMTEMATTPVVVRDGEGEAIDARGRPIGSGRLAAPRDLRARRALRRSPCPIRPCDRRNRSIVIAVISPATRKPAVPITGTARSSARPGLILFDDGLGQRLLERALAAGLAGDRQLRGPRGDAANERCSALAARDLDRSAL